MIALEADEVSVTQKSQPLKPVWPSDSLAGVPEHSPIPLAETVVDGVSNVQHSAKQVQRTADGMLRHSVYGIFDRMPRRPVRRVRVTPIAVQRERQRRVASAVVGLLLVLTVVGASLFYLAGNSSRGGRRPDESRPGCLLVGPERLVRGPRQRPRPSLERSPTARTYLEDAYRNLQVARTTVTPAVTWPTSPRRSSAISTSTTTST